MRNGEPLLVKLPNPVLVMLVGLPGSGKSTFAYRHFAPVEILSMDEFRARMRNDPASQSNSSAARTQLLAMLDQRLRNRVTTVVDSTNLRAEQRAALQTMAKESGIPTIALVFTASTEECREGLDRRASIIGDAVLARNAALLEQTLSNIDNEDHAAVVRLGNNEQADSIRFLHALPDDADPDRWFEVEQYRPSSWVFRRPADELRRHPSVLAVNRPAWDILSRVAVEMAFAARNAPEHAGPGFQDCAELRVRLPHCLPIDLVVGRGGWEHRPPHAGGREPPTARHLPITTSMGREDGS